MNTLMNQMSFFSLSNFDFFMLGVIGFSIIFSIVRGFIKSAISLTGWIIALSIGMKFYFILDPIVSKYITIGVISSVIAGITVFLVSAIIIAILNNILYVAFESLSSGFLDRSLGLLFGFIRGLLLTSFMFYILLMMMPQLSATNIKNQATLLTKIPNWAKNSQTILLLNKGADLIDPLIPLDFKRKLKAVLESENTQKKEEAPQAPEHEGATIVMHSVNKTSPIHKILDLLPKEVMDKISSDNLIVLQDGSSDSREKVAILEEIKTEYQSYINNSNQAIGNESLPQEEITHRNEEQNKLMSMIEAQIIEYDKDRAFTNNLKTVQGL